LIKSLPLASLFAFFLASFSFFSSLADLPVATAKASSFATDFSAALLLCLAPFTADYSIIEANFATSSGIRYRDFFPFDFEVVVGRLLPQGLPRAARDCSGH